MRRLVRPSLGLLGRLVAILLLAMLVEFGASTLLYERASQFAVRDDEARRLAEHLVISRRLVAERPAAARGAMAADLSTDRYALRWQTALPPPPPIAPSLDRMRRQVVAWEPTLAAADLRLRLTSPGRSSVVTGGLKLPDGSWLYFRTLEPVTGLDLAMERVLLAVIPAVALMLLGGTLIRRALRPLRRLALAADQVGSADADLIPEAVPEQGPGDVVRVVAAFNRMRTRIHRLLADRTQALAAVGHDLRTPLARLRLRAEGVADGQARDAIEADVAEMEAMIGSLLAYLGGESEPERPIRADVAVLCATLVDHAADSGRDASYVGPDHCEATVHASGLRRAVGNLIDNALHHGTAVTVTLIVRADALAIRVEDDGPGIPPEELARVMEPFVRLDAARGRTTRGFGLGLAIVRRLTEAAGGTVALVNRPEGGLRAELTLPRA